MPRPVYIICSESGSQDVNDNLLSLFRIIETLSVSEKPVPMTKEGALIVPAVSLRITAVWMKNPDDLPEQEYEFQTAIYFPPNDTEHVLHDGRFFFEVGKPFYRMMLIGQGPPAPGAGILRIENRIRPVGGTEWLRQDYPIPVIHAQQDTPVNDQPAS